MPKRRKRKATLRSAGKTVEADILERANALAEDPTLAMPICEGPCVLFSPAKAARRAILKVHAARDDEGKLQRYANSGNDLGRAYAATLLVARAQKIQYVAELRLPTGSIPYVMRGNAKPFYLAGLQNYDDRAARILSYYGWAKKRRMHFFSADRGVVCTGRRHQPPRDFVEEEMDEMDLSLREGTVWACPHGGAGPGRDAVALRWLAAGIELERCESCIGTESMLGTLLRHMAGPGLSRAFEVEVRLAPLRTAEGTSLPVVPRLPEEIRATYLRGAIPDAAVLEAGRAARADALREASQGRRLYAAGERSFGEDAEAFLAALGPTEAEARALRAALARHDAPVVLDRPSTARALSELWPQHGLAMLQAAAGDEETARRLHRDRVSSDEATDLVRRASREGGARVALAHLPRYERLPPAAAVADAITRAHRAGGPDAALRTAQERANAGKAKGVALAFLQALGQGKGQEWRFSQSDRETADALVGAAQELLAAEDAGYHEALAQISRLAGEDAAFRPQA